MKENYIFPFFWLHGEDEEKLREYMNVINDANCSAVCIESRPHPDFCGDRWWHDLNIIIDEAKKLGMKIWILDDSHFPTGFANGAALKADVSLRRQNIYTKVYNVRSGQKTMTFNLKKAMKKAIKEKPATMMSKIVSSSDKASKEVFDDDHALSITAWVDGQKKPVLLKIPSELNEKVVVNLPEGTRKVFMTFLTRNCGIHKSYINMLDHESCRLLIDAVYEPHYEHYKEEFGKTILGFFSDEPELGNGIYFKNDIKMGTDMDFSWSRELEKLMPDILGPEWRSLLPLIWDDCGNKELAGEIRLKYMDAVTRLVENCFSKQIGSWCENHNVEYIGHVIEDGNAHARTANSLGHYFRGLSGQHMAGIDDIGGQVIPFEEDAPAEGVYKMIGGRDGEFYHFMLGKLAGSMAYIQPEKKGRAMCEIFGNYGWGEGPRMEKYLADHFMVQGINHYVPHAFSPKPYPDKDCPPHFYASGHNPQYRAFSNLIAYMDRVCGLISDGRPVLETAVLYHAENEWAGEAMLDQKITRVLMENQIDFHIVPMDAFLEPDRYKTRISDGQFYINGNCYKTLIIPYAQYISSQLANLRKELEDKGIEVIYIESEDLPLDSLADSLKREIVCKPVNTRIRAMHYRKADKDIYYFVNEDDKIYSGKIKIPLIESCMAYDAWENKYYKQSFKNIGQTTELSLKLRPSESRIIIAPAVDIEETLNIPLIEIPEADRKVISFEEDWKLSVCKAIDYPAFSEAKRIKKFEDYAKHDKKFSGFIAYENTFVLPEASSQILLTIADAGEDIELFINGKSAGIQILPPFIFDVSNMLVNGRNKIRIEVATSLERERGANKKKQAKIGILSSVKIEMVK